MVTATNQIIDIQQFLYGKLLITSVSIVEVKYMMSNASTSVKLNYTSLVDKTNIQTIVQDINNFPYMNEYYNNKYLLNACAAAFDETTFPEEYEDCMSDEIMESGNNTDSLLKLIDELVDNIEKEKSTNKESDKTYDTLKLFNTTEFKQMENVFYKYITPVSQNLDKAIEQSLNDYLDKTFVILWVGCGVLVLLMIIFSFWIGVYGVKRLIHLISISRCILKIIPTIVINNTPELEQWIENKY